MRGAPNLTDNVPVGQIFFGQFIDHDITLDTTSSLCSNNTPSDVENVRTTCPENDSYSGPYIPIEFAAADSLLELPFIPSSAPAFEKSLAVRNMLRGQSFRLPSGEQVAQMLQMSGVEEVTTAGIEQVREAGEKLGFAKPPPVGLHVAGRASSRSPR